MITSLNGKKSSKTVDRTSINGRILFIMKNMSKIEKRKRLAQGRESRLAGEKVVL
jgi:hypothetical protein